MQMKHMDNEKCEIGKKDKETGPGESKPKVNMLPMLMMLKGKPAKKKGRK